MLEIARMSIKDRSDLITYVSSQLGINEAIVEKDFWVCFMLDVLFHDFIYSDHLSFKGGTSLSKGYGIIERFSEDIDIILDWRVLGYSEYEPHQERSGRAQDKFNVEISEKTRVFLQDMFVPALEEKLNELDIADYKLYMKDVNEVVFFEYPRVYKDYALVEEIRLEIGSLAAWTPLTFRNITPMIAEVLPARFSSSTTNVLTVDAKRTFWEKATILHDIAHRTSIPPRYSRHYYDLYLLAQSNIKDEAFLDVDLLKKVADFKSKFYRSNRARYDLATPENIKLLPTDEVFDELKKDYDSMQSMIYGDKIPFEKLIKGIEKLLNEIRNLND